MIETEEFIVEDLGVLEEDVYDIEVDDYHNFFGNGILVHNSVYYQIAPYVDLYLAKHHDGSVELKDLNVEQQQALTDECTDFCDKFAEGVVQKIIDKSIDEMAYDFNAYDKSRIGAKREVIADKGVYIAKKKYLLRVRVDEGTRFPVDAPHIKVMGLEIAKSTTPKWVKDKLNGSIEVILDSDENGLRKYIEKIRSEYLDAPIEDISAVLSSSNVSPYLPGESKVFGRTISSAYNKFIQDNDLLGRYTEIQPTEKYKYIFLVPQNPFGTEAIAYNSNTFCEEFIKPYIDYDKTFEKTFMASLRNMTDAMNYNVDSESTDDEDW